jgi:hypothetical protein
MSAEVIGVEIKQYAGEGVRTLVPRLVGRRPRPRPVRGAHQDEAAHETHQRMSRSLKSERPAPATGKGGGCWQSGSTTDRKSNGNEQNS